MRHPMKDSNMANRVVLTLVLVGGLGLSACTNPYDPGQRAAGGALIGAGSGAALGAIAGGGRGAAIGALAGGAVGAATGAATTPAPGYYAPGPAYAPPPAYAPAYAPSYTPAPAYAEPPPGYYDRGYGRPYGY